MSHDTESVMSSAVSISGAESFSDVGSTLNAGDNELAMPSATGPGSGLFDSGDGDLRIVISRITLETHKFIIKKFAGLKSRITNDMIALDTGEPGEEDFKNTFKILYASVVEGPFEFDSSILKSALLLAARYDYPALRAFAINKLGKAALSAVERIRLAREFDIPSWEEPAYLELCQRDEAITMPEAGVLGLETFVHVVRIREKEQRRRGKEVDAVNAVEGTTVEVGEEPPEEPGVVGVPDMPIDLEEVQSDMAQATNAPVSTSNLHEEQDNETRTEADGTEGATAPPKPCFINDPVLLDSERPQCCSTVKFGGLKIDLPVLDCNCAALLAPAMSDRFPNRQIRECRIPPCVVSAFKDLQTQQLAHKSNISGLEATVERIQAAVTSLKPTVQDNTEIVQPEPIGSGALKEDVHRWLVGQSSGASIA